MTSAVSLTEIDGRTLTPRKFHVDWVRRGRAAYLKGLVTKWEAASWTMADVRRTLQRDSVRLRVSYGEGGQSADEPVAVTDVESRFADGGSPAPNWVLDVPTNAPELTRHFSPEWCDGEVKELSLLLGRNTLSNHHYHPFRHSLLCPLHGTKRIVLHPPNDSRYLYPQSFVRVRNFHVSQVDAAAEDLDRFPLLRRAHPLEATLLPGDAIFIPVGWWHAVFGAGPVMSARFTWSARLRELPFPEPSVRSLAGAIYWHTRHRAEGLSRRSRP